MCNVVMRDNSDTVNVWSVYMLHPVGVSASSLGTSPPIKSAISDLIGGLVPRLGCVCAVTCLVSYPDRGATVWARVSLISGQPEYETTHVGMGWE